MFTEPHTLAWFVAKALEKMLKTLELVQAKPQLSLQANNRGGDDALIS